MCARKSVKLNCPDSSNEQNLYFSGIILIIGMFEMLMVMPWNSCTFHIIKKNAVYTAVNLLWVYRNNMTYAGCLHYQVDCFLILYLY